MTFTANDAYDASENGEPIMMERAMAERYVLRHGCSVEEFREECGETSEYDAWAVLSWLGY